jgi:chemotaxis protein MotB
MTYRLKRGVLPLSLVVAVLLSACVSQSKYDELQAQYQQAQQQNSALSAQVAAGKAQICRLQGAIKYTVNSDLLFPSGGWQMSDRGKDYRWLCSEVGADAAEQDPGERLYRQCPDRSGAANEILSQKGAENVMEYVVSQGVNPNLISARGSGDSNPVASNDTAQGRAQNRRVEMSLAGSNC